MVSNVHEWGDPGGTPVVCLHGVTGHGARFRRLAEERLARFRVVALDLRGHGRSEWEPPWDLETHVGDLRDTVDALGIAGAAWIGHSFGGRLVLELRARAPELVERAVLLDPAIWVPPPIALERADGIRAEQSFATAAEAVEARFESGGLFHTPPATVEEEAAVHLERGADGRLRWRYSASAVVAAFGEMAKPPPPFELLRLPTLLVRGAQTEVVPEQLADAYREEVGEQVAVVTVPGGHIVLWDAFEETADAIVRFLGSA